MSRISRRGVLQGAAGLGAASLMADAGAAVAKPASRPDFTDPRTIVRTHVKMVGSLGREVVHSFMRLNIYADLGEGNFVPCFTMNNILVDYREPQGDDIQRCASTRSATTRSSTARSRSKPSTTR
ncbi:MAG: hypothetical protein R3E65_06400 [Steroidobacteraceae bacterium]